MEIWEGWEKVTGEKIPNLEEYVNAQIEQRKTTSLSDVHDLDILIGTDSLVRARTKFTNKKTISYLTVIVFKKGTTGCHVIKRRDTEQSKLFVPTSVKLNGEINRTASLAFWFRENISLEPHIHMDVSKEVKNGSNSVYNYIKGYFEGCGFKNVEYKPAGSSWAASCVADYYL